jgi:hypothetical protein
MTAKPKSRAEISARIEEVGNLLAGRSIEEIRAYYAPLWAEQEQLRADFLVAERREGAEELAQRRKAEAST